MQAQRVVAGASDSPADVTAFRRVVANDADAIVARADAASLVDDLLTQAGGGWQRAGGNDTYTLYLKKWAP